MPKSNRKKIKVPESFNQPKRFEPTFINVSENKLFKVSFEMYIKGCCEMGSINKQAIFNNLVEILKVVEKTETRKLPDLIHRFGNKGQGGDIIKKESSKKSDYTKIFNSISKELTGDIKHWYLGSKERIFFLTDDDIFFVLAINSSMGHK